MIVYAKLANLLKERNMQWKDLCDAGISVNMPVKFSQNRTMNTEIIDKVCAYLHVQPGDIMEWVESEKEAEIAKLEAEKKQLEARILELQNK